MTGNAGGPWYVTFQGTYAATNVNLMSVDGTNLSGAADALKIETVVEGRASAGEIQSLSISPYTSEDNVGGTYTLSFDGETTAPLAYNANAATIQSALEALGTIGSRNILVAGGQGVGPDDGIEFPHNGNNWYFALVFRNALAGINVSQITADSSNIFGGAVSAGGGVFASPVGEELQHVDLDTPADGTYSLTFNGETTATLAHNASRQTVEAALEALPSISNVVVRGHPGQYVVHFTGPAGVDVSELVLNSLLVGAAASVTTLAHGAGTAGTNEVQSVTVYATGGTFTLTFDGQTTAAINYNASVGTMEFSIGSLVEHRRCYGDGQRDRRRSVADHLCGSGRGECFAVDRRWDESHRRWRDGQHGGQCGRGRQRTANHHLGHRRLRGNLYTRLRRADHGADCLRGDGRNRRVGLGGFGHD